MRRPAVEQERGARALLSVCGLVSLAAAAVSAGAGAPRLDVGLWAVLAPIVAGTVLALLRRVRTRCTRRPHGVVVMPDPAAVRSLTPHPVVQARDEAVGQARAALLAAQARGAQLEELLALARTLRRTELELGRATLSAGGHVPQALRDELALRDRPAAPVTSS